MKIRALFVALSLAGACQQRLPVPTTLPPVVAPPPAPVQPPAVVAPVAVRVDGANFVTGPGNLWTWEMIDGFRDLDILLSGGDLEPQLQETVDLGFNGRRVLLSANNLFRLVPREQPHFYDGVAQLADLYAAHGLYGHFCILQDVQAWGASLAEQQTIINQVREALGDRVNVFLSAGNEPFKNGIDPSKLHAPRPGSLFAFGSAVDGMAIYGGGDYGEFHSRRDWKWFVTVPQTILELHQKFGNPIVLDEPMGAAEQPAPNRSTDPLGFYRYGVDAALHTAGATFHSEAGLQSQLLGPVQRTCAEAFIAGLKTGSRRP